MSGSANSSQAMIGAGKRMGLGWVAGVLGVLFIHQGVWALLHNLDLPTLAMPAPYPMDPVAPWGVPRTISLCFWGGLWGAAFGGIWRGPRGSYLFGGFWLGVSALLVAFFVVAPLKGLAVAGGGNLSNWIRGIALNVTWGVGTGLITGYLVGNRARRDTFEDH